MSGAARLILCAAAVGIAAGSGGGGDPIFWNFVLLVMGIAGVASAFLPITRARSQAEKIALIGAVLCPAYVFLQLLPVPLPILRIADPTRAEIGRAVDALKLSLPATFAPISIVLGQHRIRQDVGSPLPLCGLRSCFFGRSRSRPQGTQSLDSCLPLARDRGN
jgi:hypothetical protein